MNDLAELKQFIVVHARTQGLRPADYQPVLDRIEDDEEFSPRSWAVAWRESADDLEARGDLLGAARRNIIARFPFVDDADRLGAQDQYLSTFERWAKEQRQIEPVEVDHAGTRLRCWSTGLREGGRAPLLLIMGGIISVKEQWAPTLLLARRLGLAAVVTEMPGVGENRTRYDADSWRMIPSVLDALADRADTTRTIALCLSFSGNLALRAAATDQRIRGVITAGAPVRALFTDPGWQRALPYITLDTIAHLAGTSPDRLAPVLAPMALSPQELAAIDVPVHYLASLRDEVIPGSDVDLLRAHVRRLSVLEIDDVHGSPGHVRQSRLWVLESILRLSGRGGVRTGALRALRHLVRA